MRHTDKHDGTQSFDLYGATVCFKQEDGSAEIDLYFAGGTWPDGKEVRTFRNMAHALRALANIATDLELEDGDDYLG